MSKPRASQFGIECRTMANRRQSLEIVRNLLQTSFREDWPSPLDRVVDASLGQAKTDNVEASSLFEATELSRSTIAKVRASTRSSVLFEKFSQTLARDADRKINSLVAFFDGPATLIEVVGEIS